MKQQSITLVSCCGPKLSRIAPARQLYRSPLFKKSVVYAEQLGHPWFVLSAKHGLIKPETQLAPYDASLAKATPWETQYWANAVAAELRALADFLGARRLAVTLLAGPRYAAWAPIVSEWCTVHAPMDGLPIGKRLQWLNEQMSFAEPDPFMNATNAKRNQILREERRVRAALAQSTHPREPQR